MAFRLGASLEAAYTQVNDQLAEILPGDRFITAFIGLLDPRRHRVRFHSGGQGPILHFHAASGESTHHKPTSFPLAAMPIARLRPAVELDLAPGDVLAVVSDGIFEYRNLEGEEFGEERVRTFLAAHHARPAAEISALLFAAVQEFARKTPQEDDMTVVLVKRQALP
jgi:phosphoserine phosphatase